MARNLQWYLGAEGLSGLLTGNTGVLDLLADARVDLDTGSFGGSTVTRVIGDIHFRSNTVPSGDNVQESSFGIAVFNENLPTINHPNPRTENHDWMWQTTPMWVPWTVESSAGVFRILMQTLHFDILTQRRLRNTEERLEMVVHNTGSEGIDVNLRIRALLRAP